MPTRMRISSWIDGASASARQSCPTRDRRRKPNGGSAGGGGDDDEVGAELDRRNRVRIAPGTPAAGQFLEGEAREAREALAEVGLGEGSDVTRLVVGIELGQGTGRAEVVHGHGDAEPSAGAKHREERGERC